MQGGDRRGQLDGGEEPPPTAGEHRQHPIVTGDCEDVAEGEEIDSDVSTASRPQQQAEERLYFNISLNFTTKAFYGHRKSTSN